MIYHDTFENSIRRDPKCMWEIGFLDHRIFLQGTCASICTRKAVIKSHFKVISSENFKKFLCLQEVHYCWLVSLARFFKCFGNRCFAKMTRIEGLTPPPFLSWPVAWPPIEISKQWHSLLLCVLTPLFALVSVSTFYDFCKNECQTQTNELTLR